MKPSGIGGMAVMEGVMMKNKDVYAVAVRKPNNEIAVEKSTHKDISDNVKLFKLPIFRGMLAFVDSMVIGVKVLNYSASFFEEEEETQASKKKKKADHKSEKKAKEDDTDFIVEDVSSTASEEAVSLEHIDRKDNQSKDEKKDGSDNKLLMAFAVLISIVMSVVLFMVLPVFITNLFSSFAKGRFLIAFIEGIVRLVIFIGYVILASRMQEIKRVFMYHGAEHKTINCLENGFELTVENVKWQSKEHKRCGTSFMLLVILISLVFFMILPSMNLLWRVLSRVILVPFIAGVSYEFIRLAGRSESKIVNILSKPGLWMQALTTKEPDDTMIEVAIVSVGAVFDWRAFLETSTQEKNNTKTPDTKTITTKKSNTGKDAAATGKTSAKEGQSTKPAATAKKTSVTKSSDTVKESSVEKSAASEKQAAQAKQTATDINKEASVHHEARQHNMGTAPVNFKPVTPSRPDEEDDEILKALDKFFDSGLRETKKISENE